MTIRRAMYWGVFIATASLPQPAPQLTDVLTQHNNTARTGANLRETILTRANVNSQQFGKLYDVPVDGFIYAQPLVVTDLFINGQVRNVVFVATEHNSLYALDADKNEQIWKQNYGPSMPTPSVYLSSGGSNGPYGDLVPEIGITSTPVIDKETRTLYFTTFEQRPEQVAPFVTFHHSLHAVDLADGSGKMGGPVEVEVCKTSPKAVAIQQGKIHGGRHTVNTQMCLEPMQHLQRPAVLLVKPPGALGQIILAFGSHADYPVFHGWVVSFQADNIRKQLGAWVSNLDNAPSGSGGGIWQGGMGPALDDQYNFYVMVGNGPVDHDTAFGDSFLRFSTAQNTITRTDFFTPCNEEFLDAHDMDVGSSGPLLLIDSALTPAPNYVVGGGKQGRIYVLNKDQLGGFSKCFLLDMDRQIPQEFAAVRTLPLVHSQHIHGSPVYWKSAQRGPLIYVWGESDLLRAYPLTYNAGGFSLWVFLKNLLHLLWPWGTHEASESGWHFNAEPDSWATGAQTSPAQPWTELRWMMTGGMLSLTANGDHDGIVWATTPYNNDANAFAVPGILRAYNADDLRQELWNSYQDLARDDFGNFAKFTPATIANGKVYVATLSGHLSVYGLRPYSPRSVPVNLVQNPGFESGAEPWTTTTPGHFFVQLNFPYYGKASGVLCTALQQGAEPTVCPKAESLYESADAVLSQTIAATGTGQYRLSARCATNIPSKNLWITPGSVSLAVHVDGRSAGEQTIRASAGYQVYTLDFQAAKGQQIEILYSAPAAKINGSVQRALIRPEAWAVIDDVSLTPPQA